MNHRRQRANHMVTPVLFALLLSAFLVAGCAGDEAPTTTNEEAQTQESDNQAESGNPAEIPVPEDGATWITMLDFGGFKVRNTDTDEWVKLSEFTLLYEFDEVDEYVWKDYSTSDFPTSMHVEHSGDSDAFEGDVADPDVIDDLWVRVMQLHLYPDLVKPDKGTYPISTFSFAWDDGRTQTYTVKTDNLLVYDGKQYLIAETEYTNGEVFNGPVVQRDTNNRYPGAILNDARTEIEIQQGEGTGFIVKEEGEVKAYEESGFWWNASGGSMSARYAVDLEEGSPTSIVITQSWRTEHQCRITDASRIYEILELEDEDGRYLDISYQPASKEEKTIEHCTVRYADGELVASQTEAKN